MITRDLSSEELRYANRDVLANHLAKVQAERAQLAADLAAMTEAFDESDTARLAAQAANWFVPRISHDEDAPVGPRIHAGWIFRSAGQSHSDHTRQYAAQLLAAADELDARHAAMEATR